MEFHGRGKPARKRGVRIAAFCALAILVRCIVVAILERQSSHLLLHIGEALIALCALGWLVKSLRRQESADAKPEIAEEPPPPEQEDLNKIDLLIEWDAIQKDLEEANRRLQAQANTDALTGLGNRRHFDRELEAAVSQASRYILPLSLILIDVDHFKSYNDEFGHVAGDEALQQFADVLREQIRLGDILARYGGEEFALILPHTELEPACEVAERIRRMAAAHEFPNRIVTCSLGVASLHAHAENAADLVIAADRALYRAKAEGRNQVRLASPSDPSLMGGSGVPLAIYLNDDPLQGKQSSLEAELRPWPEEQVTAADSLGGVEGITQIPSGAILLALLAALDQRDNEMMGHSLRVTRFALYLARALSTEAASLPENIRVKYQLTPADLNELALGGLLHDVGKIHVPDAVLRKQGELTRIDWEIIHRHPLLGFNLVRSMPVLSAGGSVVRHHHEHWDGSGYPDSLAQQDIPLVARIFSIADALDAMISNRPHRKARSLEEACQEIARQAGTQFDPVLVQVFKKIPESDWEMLGAGRVTGEISRAA